MSVSCSIKILESQKKQQLHECRAIVSEYQELQATQKEVDRRGQVLAKQQDHLTHRYVLLEV